MKTFDSKCLDLAQAFLLDASDALRAIPGKAEELAAEIQGCIEDWLGEEERRTGGQG